jgi:diguanylate cyclase (GGDEF)-like protein
MNCLRILLAEDDPDHQRLLQRALTEGRPHVAVTSVSTGAALLKAVRESTFHCIILDFHLKDCDATDALMMLADAGNETPAIVTSSIDTQAVVIESIRSGGVDFVPKMEAVEGDVLWHRIEVALADHRQSHATRRTMERRQQVLTEMAVTDPLTGLHNRRYLDQAFRHRRHRFDRRGKTMITMIDVDRFKRVNDRYGHPVGDLVLQAVAEQLRRSAAPNDVVCRWGGEEFTVIKPGTTFTEAVLWAERCRGRVAALRVPAEKRALSVTVSIGVSSCPGRQVDDQAMEQADQAMYLAKHQGRNRVCTWEMVVFDRAARAASKAPSPENRLHHVLETCWSALGPTQQNHLTTHAWYVSNMACKLGRVLGMDDDALEHLRIAGLVHDLGKFVLPESVLAKPGPLTEDERALISYHSRLGAEMAEHLGIGAKASTYVRYHHARFDGSGPRTRGNRQRRDAIPLGGRILAVADAFVTITSERPYRTGRSATAAIQELRRQRGTQFDPVVIDAIPRALMADIPTHAPV